MVIPARKNLSTDRKLFVILGVFRGIGPGLYHEDAKTQGIARFMET